MHMKLKRLHKNIFIDYFPTICIILEEMHEHSVSIELRLI